MLVKTTIAGNAITYTPNESLPYAVEYGVKSKNDSDFIYWALKDTVLSADTHHITVPVKDRKKKEMVGMEEFGQKRNVSQGVDSRLYSDFGPIFH